MLKYPRTPHLEGSRLQDGDHDLSQVPFSSLAQHPYIVVEEKIDGANAGISFDDGKLMLQSRGHYLTGGAREKHFNLFKTWAACHEVELYMILGDRYIMYGEWCYAKHTVYYDRLPHYFLEFDIYDRETGLFLSTAARRDLLEDSPVVSVPVVWEGPGVDALHPKDHVAPSLYKSAAWIDVLREQASRSGVDPDQAVQETDGHQKSEGVYIKIEDPSAGTTIGRLKWVRHTFLNSIMDSGTHWLNRPIVVNQLATDVDIWASPSSN